MDRQLFDAQIRETYAAYGKADPRGAVLDAAYKQVADLPDDFIVWACERLQDSDKLPPNIGRELRKSLYQCWLASLMPTFSNEQYYNDLCGDPGCPECHGKGWFYVWRKGARPGTAPTAIPCLCNVTCDAFSDIELRKASLADLKAGGWTFHEPPMERTRPPQPMRRSLQELIASIHDGQGIPEDRPDPRREMPEAYL